MGLQFLNSMYKRKRFEFDSNTNKRVLASRDALIYTVVDTDTNETKLVVEPEPKINFFVANTEQKYHRFSIPKEEVAPVTVKYGDRDKELAGAVNQKNEFYDSFKTKTNYEFMENLRANPYLYMADVNIEDYTKTFFMLEHGKHYGKVKKSFMDIEVDISKHDGFPYPDAAPCPINVISFIDNNSMSLYSFILVQEENKDQILEVMNNQQLFIDEYIADDVKSRFNINLKFYNTELDLVVDFFNIVHTLKPDFLGIWNMNFDMKTVLNRLKKCGVLPRQIPDIICHPEVPSEFRYVQYNEEEGRSGGFSHTTASESDDDDDDDEVAASSFGGKHPSRYWDWVEAPGYTQIYDQMSLFSNLRKRDILPSYKLEVIGEEYGGVHKLDLNALGYSIKDVNLKNFKIFLKYNIQDVFVQYMIEESQEDIDKYILFTDNTRLAKGTAVSNTIKNMIMYYLWENGEVIGNSVRYDISEKLDGAIVARPELIDQLGQEILGVKSFVFNNSIDLDAASEYPSIMIMFNITKSAVYGRVTEVDRPNGDYISDGRDIMGKLETIDHSIFDLAKDYLGLPNPEDMICLIEKGLIDATKH